MLNLLLAAAVAAASPALPPADIGKDARLVCAARFVEELKIARDGLQGHEPQVINIYAAKTGITPAQKLELTSFCNMFDAGAMFVIQQANEQAAQGRPHPIGHPTDSIASFAR